MGTSKYSNHSTTGSATPTRCENHSTFALGYQQAKEHIHVVCQQFFSNLSMFACSMQPIHGKRGSLDF